MFQTRNKATILAAAMTVFSAIAPAHAAEVKMEGAEIGAWTMDYDAGANLAKENNLAIFLDFTGSDWCGWCKLMDRKVFSEPSWSAFAKDKLSLIKVDFPKGKKLPQDIRQRNRGLQQRFKVSGFPTYVILDSDGETEIARLGAGRNKSADSFIKEVEFAIRHSAVGVADFTANLEPEEASRYRNLIAEQRTVEEELEAWLKTRPDSSAANVSKYTGYHDELTRLSIAIDKIESSVLSKDMDPEDAKAYLALVDDLHGAKNELNDWLKSKPPRNEENEQKRDGMQAVIQALSDQLSKY